MKTACLAALMIFGISAQTPLFHADVSLAHIDACVVGQNGRVIIGLKREDFQVFDNEEEQSLIGFAAEQQSMDIILLFDVSGSMRSVARKVAAAGQSAFQELRPDDSVSIMTFNVDLSMVTRSTKILSEIQSGIDGVAAGHFGGGTRIQDSVMATTRHFPSYDMSTDARRRAVLVITDNLGRPAKSQIAVIKEFWETDSVLSGLIIGHRKSPHELITGHAPGGVNRITEMTGGETIYTNDPAQTFAEMIHRLRTRYSLYYRMPDTTPLGKIRKIRVVLSQEAQKRLPGAHVLARQGYMVHAKDENGFTLR